MLFRTRKVREATVARSALDKYISKKFARAKVRFYHAENLRNFSTYVSAKALLSRSELMKRDPEKYTRFYSDEADEKLGALTRVFGNIYDFGSIFARGRDTVPNVYGPIVLVFKPEVFAEMSDIAITPKSIATHLDKWTSVRVTERSVIDEIVVGDDYGRPVADAWQGSELSCEGPTLSFASLEKVLVEPISIDGVALIDYVREVAASLKVPMKVRPYSRDENRARLQDLVDACESLDDAIDHDEWSYREGDLPESWASLDEAKRKRVPGWSRHFYYGTLGECRLRTYLDALDAADDGVSCEMCDPGPDRPAPILAFHPLDGGGPGTGPLDIAYCDFCNGISVRCTQCDAIHPVHEHEYKKVIVCDGECGIRFTVEPTRDGPLSVVIVGDDEFDDDVFNR